MNKIILCEQDMIEFNNCFTYSDGTFANISIRSMIPKDKVINLEDLEKTLLSVFSNRKSISEVEVVVWAVRTIFNNFDEKELTIQTGKNNNVTSTIHYKDSIMDKYENSFDCELNSSISYELGEKISFLISRDMAKKMKETIISKIEKEINLIETLGNLKGKNELFDYEKCLCKAYSLFYGESPDFREKDNIIKTHVMAMILHNYEISLENTNCFVMDNGFPSSINISNIIYFLRPLGHITSENYGIHFRDEIEEEIEKIGNVIKENIQGNFINEIAVLGSVLYARDRRENEDISKVTGYDKGSIQRSLYLIEKIQHARKEIINRRRKEKTIFALLLK